MLLTKRQLANCVLLSTLMLLNIGSANADPNLQNVTKYDGVVIFGDHRDPRQFYYLRSTKQLASRESAPDFHFILNRFIGTRQTGNSDEFWVRGVIDFATTLDSSKFSYAGMTEQLSQNGADRVKLVAAPVTDSYNRLVYATIEVEGGNVFSGSLEGGHMAEIDTQSGEQTDKQDDPATGLLYGSKKQRHTIGLSAHDANLFWENFEKENLSLSLAYGWQVKGLIQNVDSEWVDSTYSVDSALPILVSPTNYPKLFVKNELWQRVSYTHSKLLVMCYDFINIDDSDLYYVMVEVRFPTVRDQFYTETVKFIKGSDEYEKTINFELANDINKGYQYRVRRLTEEGERSQSEWLDSTRGFLDVSMLQSDLAINDN